ncbi:MAG: dihydroorotate dehydrogenase electron transfer subunit [Candidatus Omnitrophica bacterium]|nr:dihydroorotate dehydrogenase electron transfer subunit [Candidatus Omnitrophota bacterium]
MKQYLEIAKILKNTHIVGPYWKLKLSVSELAHRASSGQFVMLKVDSDQGPLLRRPFSIHQVKGKTVELLYEVRGKATEILAKMKAGQRLSLLGPLGTGFSLCDLSYVPLLVAGGIGVAPLVFLAQNLRNRKGLAILGAQKKERILCEKEFKATGFRVKISTNDGSRGFYGRVTELLEELLAKDTLLRKKAFLYACGPRPMLKQTIMLSKKYNIPGQVSLETHMACGIGACCGCVVQTLTGYKRVCKEGPVFAIKELTEEGLAE